MFRSSERFAQLRREQEASGILASAQQAQAVVNHGNEGEGAQQLVEAAVGPEEAVQQPLLIDSLYQLQPPSPASVNPCNAPHFNQ